MNMKMKFEDVLPLLKGIPRSSIIMNFRYTNYEGKTIYVRSARVSGIYKDWYRDCEFCPPNDTYARQIHMLLPTTPETTQVDIIDKVPFGTLMEQIENLTEGHEVHE